MVRVVAKLDGTNDLVALLGSEPVADAFYILRMLGWFAQSGMIVAGPAPAASSNLLPDLPAPRLDRMLVLPESGRFATALAHSMRAAGANAHRGSAGDAERLGAILLVCLDGPDLASLETANCAAIEAGIDWLPIFPFGDAIVIGPSVPPGGAPCFRCFELRWLGISPSIALERAYFAYLRRGGWRRDCEITIGEVDRIADLAATVVIRCLSRSDGESVTLVRRESHAVFHGLLEAHPLCEVCGASSPASRERAVYEAVDWFEPAIPLAELGATIGALAEGPCGLAAIVPRPKSHERPQDLRLPKVAVGRFALPEPEEVDGKQANWCHGSASRAEDARTLAIIEGLERYAGLCPAPVGVTAPYSSVAAQAILPTELPLYSRAQYCAPGFPFQPFDPERMIEWSWGYNLTQGKPVLVPTTAVWYGRTDDLLDETSSGVAAHSSRGRALLNGALELIERDAFMIHWLQSLSPPLIDLERIDDATKQAQICQVEASGYMVRVADLNSDLDVPVFLAIGFRDDRRAPALIVGAGASLDASTALARALKELYAATLNPSPQWRLGPALGLQDVRCLEDHARAYEHPDWLPRASFLWDSPQRVEFRGPRTRADDGDIHDADSLTQLIARLAEHGHDLIGVDMTPPEIERRHLKVVRAIVPGLQPLGFADRVRLGGRRLQEAPARMGYRTASTHEESLNRIPHCFP
jgi:ribosomal protein S12 methylthiotransferase accessory factor